MLPNKISEISKKIEVLFNQKDRIMMKDKMIETSQKNSRTRTLIQIGSLVEKSSIFQLFNIELGDDLLSNLDENYKTVSLFGFLIHAKDNFLENEDILRKKFYEIGKKALT